ncbi:MAG: hypothetical protein AUK63_342 [bacterium P3]|nr:MAG: hypothetical protein AUK63_342 [bacterium P3]KWW42698.1 MAG: hypothetical protein F083_102 [bacterium F083]
MKRIIFFIMGAVLGMGAMAQTKSLSHERLGKLQQRAEMQKNSQQRQRNLLQLDQLGLRADEATSPLTPAKENKALPAVQWATEMPADRWFPGEWEEVQAIVVTFPYHTYPADHVGEEDYNAQIYLPGMGMLYKWSSSSNQWQYYNGGWGAVKGTPDTTDYNSEIAYYRQYLNTQYASAAQEYIEYFQGQEDFRNVFVNLIDGIQQAAQVWIAVWQLSDSTLIKDFMSSVGKPLTNYRFIECYANAFWYRDCGPICFYYGDNDDIALLNFEYSGRACDDLLPDSIASQTGLPNYTTSIEWEGGNCLVDGAGSLVTSDAIYDENADSYGQTYATGNANNPVDYRNKTPLSRSAVLDSMQRMFGTTYIVPRLQYDGGTGHVDLYADMWDENEFIFSQYPTQYSSWTDYSTANNNINTLTSHQSIFGLNYKKTYIPFPSRDDGSYFTSQRTYNDSYTRSYSNHTFVNNMIIQPCFSPVVDGEPSADWDRANLDSLRKAYPGYTFYPIDIRSFDGYGGAIHCITKQIPAENPVRILHPSVTRHAGVQRTENISMNATVTNRSGIASVTLYWRVDDGSWHSTAMTAGDDNRYTGSINFAEAGMTSGQQGTVNYYISATSNNGKTVTKPITAAQGGYYTFDVIYDAGAGIQHVTEQSVGRFRPNPANGNTTIALDASLKGHVSVIDAMGRVIRHDCLNTNHDGQYTLDTRGMARGVYSVRFIDDNGASVVRRLLVQ